MRSGAVVIGKTTFVLREFGEDTDDNLTETNGITESKTLSCFHPVVFVGPVEGTPPPHPPTHSSSSSSPLCFVLLCFSTPGDSSGFYSCDSCRGGEQCRKIRCDALSRCFCFPSEFYNVLWTKAKIAGEKKRNKKERTTEKVKKEIKQMCMRKKTLRQYVSRK